MNRDIYIVLDNIKYAQNVGPIFRTADAFGVKKIFLCRNNFQKLNPNQLRILHKASRGATEWVDWEFAASSIEVIKVLKSKRVRIVGIETGENSQYLDELQLDSSVALVFGSEDDGICADVLELTDSIAKIPMQGRGKSLNVSTSVSIALYQVFKSLNI